MKYLVRLQLLEHVLWVLKVGLSNTQQTLGFDCPIRKSEVLLDSLLV